MTTLDPEQKEYVDLTFSSSQRLNRLLTDILDLSKVEAGKLAIKPDTFSLRDVMHSIEDIFALTVQENENEICVQVDPDLPDVLLGDSTRLTQILFNLAGNACKYTQNGRIDVQACLLWSSNAHCRILFTIADNGPGIADDMLTQVFETFTQAIAPESLYTRQHEGAGLGLPLVKRLVQLMNGNASMISQAGKGTTVYVSLPFQVPEQ